jgi:predicted DNA-binding mobile mystery protein A
MRSPDIRPLARSAIDRELAPLRKVNAAYSRPGFGWTRAIREAIGMTTGQLAKRIGVSQPRVIAIEKAEANDSITLKTLRQAAEALNCTLVYVLLPNEPLDKILHERARGLANEQLARTHHTMKLENQAVESRRLKTERDRIANELLRGDPRRLWDKP